MNPHSNKKQSLPLTWLVIVLILISATPHVLAQAPEFEAPVVMGKEVNSLSEDLSLIPSPDGKTLYFVRALDPRNIGGELAGSDIWISVKDSLGGWRPATNQTPWNNKKNNAVIGVSADGKTVHLLNTYSGKSGVAFSRFIDRKWSKPQSVSIPGIDGGDFIGFYMNPTFSVLLISMAGAGTIGQEDLYVSLRDSTDRWTKPVNLGTTINTDGFEISPFLSRDGKQLYFSSNGHGGLGDADIFVSDRLYDSWTVWSKPRNLGPGINSEKFDSYFSISSDSAAFFSSNRNSKFSDIYKAKIKNRQNSILKDSVDRIVSDAQKLLSQLKTTSTGAAVKYLSMDDALNSGKVKSELNNIMTAYKGKSIAKVELLVSTTSVTDQVRKGIENISGFFANAGINKEKLNVKIVTRQELTSFEVRVY